MSTSNCNSLATPIVCTVSNNQDGDNPTSETNHKIGEGVIGRIPVVQFIPLTQVPVLPVIVNNMDQYHQQTSSHMSGQLINNENSCSVSPLSSVTNNSLQTLNTTSNIQVPVTNNCVFPTQQNTLKRLLTADHSDLVAADKYVNSVPAEKTCNTQYGDISPSKKLKLSQVQNQTHGSEQYVKKGDFVRYTNNDYTGDHPLRIDSKLSSPSVDKSCKLMDPMGSNSQSSIVELDTSSPAIASKNAELKLHRSLSNKAEFGPYEPVSTKSQEPSTGSHCAEFDLHEPAKRLHSTESDLHEQSTGPHSAELQSQKPSVGPHSAEYQSNEPATRPHSAEYQSKEPSTRPHSAEYQSDEASIGLHGAEYDLHEPSTGSPEPSTEAHHSKANSLKKSKPLRSGKMENLTDKQNEAVEIPETVLSQGRRQRECRRRGGGNSVMCPICKAQVKTAQFSSHYDLEVARMEKWSHDYGRKQKKRLSSGTALSQSSSTTEEVMTHEERYKTYLKVKVNREKREQGVSQSKEVGTECPVCGKRILGNQQQVNRHVNMCLVKEDANVDIEGSDNDEGEDQQEVDVADDDQFEEYEWAGQTRVRVTTMIGNSFAESGFTVGQRCSEEDVGELNIDGDETDVYGEAQYNEADLIPCQADEPEEEKQRQALRNVMLQGKGHSLSTSSSNDRKWSPCTDDSQSNNLIDTGQKEGMSRRISTKRTVEILEEKIQSLQKELADNHADKYKCLICMEFYTKPVTSIQCWHVYCEECWLRTLGAKKLCPQCNMITHPADLRKIYL